MDVNILAQGVVIGFSIAAPVGPIGVLCIRRTLADGRAFGLVSGLGAAAADAICDILSPLKRGASTDRSCCFGALYGNPLSAGKNIQSGVVICVEHHTAMRTNMQTFRERFLSQTVTPGADLGRVVRGNLDHCLTSICGFIRQHSKEVTPTRVTHALGDVAAAQAIDVQILDGDKAEASDQCGRNLVMKVVTLVGNVFVQAAYLAGQFAILATAPLATRATALQNGQSFFRCAKPARVVDVLVRGQRGKGQQPHVNPNGRSDAVIRFGIRQFQLKAGRPVAEIVPLEDDHLDLGIAGDRAVLEQSHQTDVLDVEPPRLEADPVTVDVADRFEPTLALETRVARFLAGLHAPEECLEGFIQAAQGLLDRRIVEPGGILVKLAQFLELVGLVIVVEADATFLPRHTPFLESRIVKLAMNLPHAIKRLTLRVIRVETKFVAQQHLLTRLCLNIAPHRFSRYVARCANIVAARPQRWQAAVKPVELLAQFVAGVPLKAVHDLAYRQCRWKLDQQMYVVGLDFQCDNVTLERLDLFADQFIESLRNPVGQDRTAILGAPYQVVRDIVDCVSRSFGLHKLILAQMFVDVKSNSRERSERHSPPL